MIRTPRDKAEISDKEIPRAKEAHVAVVMVTKDEIRDMGNQIAFMSCLLRDKAELNDENAWRNR